MKNEVKLMEADGSKSIGCYGCARTFETVAQIGAHEYAVGHGFFGSFKKLRCAAASVG
jgi:hypothetical protein